MKIINDDDIKKIISNEFNEDYWYSELGKSNSIENNEKTDNELIYSFYEQGIYLWHKHQSKLKNILCENDKKEPKENIKELIEGNIKELIVNIISILVTGYALPLAISIPLCSLAIKKGIYKLCKD